MKKSSKFFLIIITTLIVGWIWTRPNLHEPLSNYSAYDEGFKLGYGSYPDTCESMFCKAHNKSKWMQFVP